jgi:hypothetical protein
MNALLRKISVLCLVLVLAGAGWAGCGKDGCCAKSDDKKACEDKDKGCSGDKKSCEDKKADEKPADDKAAADKAA